MLKATIIAASAGFASAQKFVTYNTGLTSFVPFYEERRHEVPKALSTLDADVVCLQEVWESPDYFEIFDVAKENYPYYQIFKPSEVDEKPTVGACSKGASQLLGLAPCLMGAQCKALMEDALSDLPYEEKQAAFKKLIACVKENCPDAYKKVHDEPSCFACVILAGQAGGVTEMLQCSNASSPRAYRSNQFGTMLLSKYPFKNTYAEELQWSVVPRANLYGEVTIGGTSVGVSCTHLSVGIGEDELEQLSQIKAINDHAAAQKPKDQIFMGDLNTGYADEDRDFSEDCPAGLTKLEELGWTSVYQQWEERQCTWCGDNPVTTGDPVNSLIDHILVKGTKFKADDPKLQAARIYDKPYGSLGYPLSDHYGIEVEWPASSTESTEAATEEPTEEPTLEEEETTEEPTEAPTSAAFTFQLNAGVLVASFVTGLYRLF